MRKYIVIFLIGFLSSNVFSQKVIQMEYSNGVYKLPCHVNGAKLKMIFDTGASSVVISLSQPNTFIRMIILQIVISGALVSHK